MICEGRLRREVDDADGNDEDGNDDGNDDDACMCTHAHMHLLRQTKEKAIERKHRCLQLDALRCFDERLEPTGRFVFKLII